MQIHKVKTLFYTDDCCLRDIINKTFNCFSRTSSQNISCKNKYYRRKSIFTKFQFDLIWNGYNNNHIAELFRNSKKCNTKFNVQLKPYWSQWY